MTVAEVNSKAVVEGSLMHVMEMKGNDSLACSKRHRFDLCLLPVACLAMGLLVAFFYSMNLSGFWIRVLGCLWLFTVPGSSMVFWIRDRVPFHVFLGLSGALSWSLIAFILWVWSLTGWSLSSAFWVIWIGSSVQLTGFVYQLWVARNTGNKIEKRSDWWARLVLILVFMGFACQQQNVGTSSDIFPAASVAARFWAADHVMKDRPEVGASPIDNTHFKSILALAAHMLHTYPVDLLRIEKTICTVLIALLFSALPYLMGFGSASSFGTLLFLLILLPAQMTGWMVLSCPNWAMGLSLGGILLALAYVQKGRVEDAIMAAVLLAGGSILHDFALFYNAASLALVTLVSLVVHLSDRVALRRAVMIFLLACLSILPVLAVRYWELSGTGSIQQLNLEKWSRGPMFHFFGHQARYFPIWRVASLYGVPVSFCVPFFALLAFALWPQLDRSYRNGWLAIFVWPVCVLAFPPIYHGLSEVVGLPTVRRLFILFPIYESLLFGAAFTVLGTIPWRRDVRVRRLLIGFATILVMLFRMPSAAIGMLNQLEYHPPEWPSPSPWAWADAYRVIRLRKGEVPVTVLDAPWLMHQGLTSGLTGQKSMLGHSFIQDGRVFKNFVSSVRALDPFVSFNETLRELDQYGVRYVILNEDFVPRASRAKFALKKDSFRLLHHSSGCYLYEYLGHGSESGVDIPDETLNTLAFIPNISPASPNQIPPEAELIRFDNGIVLHRVQLIPDSRLLRVSLWWSRTSDYKRGLEIRDLTDGETRLTRGSSDAYRVCFTLFHADLYGKGALVTLKRRLLETVGRSPSRLAPHNSLLTSKRRYPHPMVWEDRPQTIFENWPPYLWKEEDIWREDYELIIPNTLVSGRYELRLRQGGYPDDVHLGQAVAEITL